MPKQRITDAIQRVETGHPETADAEIIRQHINCLALRAIADRDRILAIQKAAWDVCKAASHDGDVRGAVEHLAAVSQYRWDF